MSAPSTDRAPLAASFRVAWILWVVFAGAGIATYLSFTDIHVQRTYGLLAASSLLVQALVVPFYVRRARFVNRVQAIIRSASAGVAFAGVTLPVLLLGASLAVRPAGVVPFQHFQPGYLFVILLIAGAGCGAHLGGLQWRGDGLGVGERLVGPESPGRRYVHSALVWIASATISATAVAGRSRINTGADAIALLVLVIGGGGLLVIAPIPVISRARRSTGPGVRIWTYSWMSLVALALLWIAGIASGLAAQSLMAAYLIGGLPYLVWLWIPCLLWATLEGLSESEPATVVPARMPSVWRSGTWSAGVQAIAILAGLLSAAPPALGLRGVGCLVSYATTAAEVRFWEAYKGVGSRDDSPRGILIRPAIDPTACALVKPQDAALMDDARQLTLGYAEAARSWYWLIDKEAWDEPGTRRIRDALAGLLGREFATYDELRDWWNLNGDALVWSGRGIRLDVRPKTPQDLAHPQTSPRMQLPSAPPSAVELIHQHGAGSLATLESNTIDDAPAPFRAALLDPDARLRGLTLAASDQIDVLSGERERADRAFLERLTGQQWTSPSQWQLAFAGDPPPAPWRVSRASALEWIGLIESYGRTEHYRSLYVERLRELTGLNYSTPEAYVPWLEDPANTRQEEWLKGREIAGGLPDDPQRENNLRRAIGRLKQITSESFATPAEWVKWWERERSHLVLTRDACRLRAGW